MLDKFRLHFSTKYIPHSPKIFSLATRLIVKSLSAIWQLTGLI